MILTDKSDLDFGKYLISRIIKDKKLKDILMIIESQGYTFFDLPFEMQYGVLVDWFDSVGMQIYIKSTPSKTWSIYIDNFGHHILTEYVIAQTRQEARTEAIRKANEIYNLNNK